MMHCFACGISIFFLTSFVVVPKQPKVFFQVCVVNIHKQPISGARVVLYDQKQDYEFEENSIGKPLITNEKGCVVFKGLEEKIYFVDVHWADLNNVGGGVQSKKLIKGFANRLTTIIE